MPLDEMAPAQRRPHTVILLVLLTALGGLGLLTGHLATLHVAAVRAASVSPAATVRAGTGPPPLRVVRAVVRFRPGPAPATPPVIRARSGILVDVDSGVILWQQDAHDELPPASTTKILTALVALENLAPTRQVTVTPDALGQAPDETTMGLKAGETLTVQELVTGALLVSGNDAATALATDTVGLDRFVAAMNAQVAALGLHDSHFTSSVGLEDPGLYSSAYDLAVLSTVAVDRFALFREVVAMRSAQLAATTGHPAFALRTVDALLGMYPFAVGIKPGWTAAAGHCEVGMAVRDGHRLISVLLGAPYAFRQSRGLLDWGFVQEGLPSTLPAPSPSPSHHG